jgi:hypothetical protein
VRIEPWLYYAALDSGRTKQSLEVQLSIVKTGASGLLSGAIHIYGIELRFSSRMEG